MARKVPLALRLDPEIRAIAEERAKEETRTLTSYLEWLIVQDAKRTGAMHQGGVQSKPKQASSVQDAESRTARVTSGDASPSAQSAKRRK
jgi:hypothetical protein